MGLHPSELCSRRVAVRRLRRRSPHGVGPTRFHLDVPLPLMPAKAETSSDPNNRRPFKPRPKPWPAETAAAHLAGTEAPTSRTVARPSGAEAPSCRTVAQLSGTEVPSSRTVDRSVCAETQPSRASTRSVEAIGRSRPPRRTRRSALCAPIRRPPPVGHRSAPRGPEGPRGPDRPLACSRPESLDRFERFHPHPVAAEAVSGIRRPQPDAIETEAPPAPNEPPAPPVPEGAGFAFDPAFRAPTRRPNRIQRALRLAASKTEIIDETSRRSPPRDRSPSDSSSSARSSRGRSPVRTERAVEMAPRASSPSGV
jgi:hypothetical protein